MTMAVIIGNRGFFPDQLANRPEEMIQTLTKDLRLGSMGARPAAFNTVRYSNSWA